MHFPRPSDVPFTAGVSGVVFVVAIFQFGTVDMWWVEPLILAAWGLIYLLEWGIRARRGELGAGLSGTPRGSRFRGPLRPGRSPDSTGGVRR